MKNWESCRLGDHEYAGDNAEDADTADADLEPRARVCVNCGIRRMDAEHIAELEAKVEALGNLDSSHPLDQRILELAAAMKAKFVAREAKHPGRDSVTHRNFNWREGLDPLAIRDHFWKEVHEFADAPAGADEGAEAVDVVNMAFLIRRLCMDRQDEGKPPEDDA